MDVIRGVLFVSVVLAEHIAGSIECYTCANVSAVCECKTVTSCSSITAACFSERYDTANGLRYNLGCREITHCQPTHRPLSLVGRASDRNCSQCCHVTNCNRELCQDPDPFCSDSTALNCSFVGSTTNYCVDTDHVKIYCKRFCGLCGLRDGGWVTWSPWSTCDKTCGSGTQTRTRMCTNPSPRECGQTCTGQSSESQSCSLDLCPVHGSWSTWSLWGLCSASCDIGMQRRDRACSSPYPVRGGDPCYGESRDDRLCIMSGCFDGGWSDWESWGSCSGTCDFGIRSRSRRCDNPRPSLTGHSCTGDAMQTEFCIHSGRHLEAGHWSAWNSWQAITLAFRYQVHKRNRTCQNQAICGKCNGHSAEEATTVPSGSYITPIES